MPVSLPVSSGKSQKTLSSFFTPKATNLGNGFPTGTPTAVDETKTSKHRLRDLSPSEIAASSKASTSGHSTEEDDYPVPPAKRARTSQTGRTKSLNRDGKFADESLKENDESGHNNSLQFADANRHLQRTQPALKPSKATERTAKYLFNPSQETGIDNENEEMQDDTDHARKAELHRRFVKKLGKPDSIMEIKRRNRALLDDGSGDTADGDANNDGEEDEEAEPAAKTAGKGRGTKKATNKLTPMEKQVIDLKRSHPDAVLIVEVGYKCRFFGEDARVAARELKIMCIPGKLRFDEHPSEAHLDRFASASIPVHRLHVHVKRLVAAGHKVGVVRQMETAALKAVGDNRNTPFTRKLTNLYTKGTYVDDVEGLMDGDREGSPGPTAQSPATGFLLCLTEENTKGYGNDEKVNVGLLAVQPATGDVIYDDFEDGFMRSEIETRLLHIAPCEFLIVGELSKATEKLVMHLSGTKMNVFGDRARVEKIEKKKTAAAMASNDVSNFYAGKMAESKIDDGQAGKVLDKILGLPENAMICLSAMIMHLAEYGLEHVFDLTKYFQPFSARSHVLLNGNTLSSLEIYQNATDHTVKGSLFWTLDRTQTRFGSRLLRKWVGRPLLDQASIELRSDAVTELLESANTVHSEKVRKILNKIRIDLEKSLIRIYYGKCTRPELLNVLQALQMIAGEFAHVTSPAGTGFESPSIAGAIMTLPSILAEVIAYLDQINLSAAEKDDKYGFFREEVENDTISNHRLGIASVGADLDAFRTVAAGKLGRRQPVTYATVAGIDYLIEVENSSASIKKVPASWAKISGTKKLSRFHPPEVVRLVRERDQHREALAAACDAAFKDLLLDISSKYQLFRDAVAGLATLDCLCSLATVASQPGYIRPTFSGDGVAKIKVKGARHPMIEQLLVDSYVPNDVVLANTPDGTRALLVTGPNMGGKSSYVRSIALIAIMAQIGSYVPADSAELGILDAVFTRVGAFDNMLAGESTFMVELGETSEILRHCGARSLVVLDELGRGTSTHDGVAIAGAVLDYLVRVKKCLTLFITHYQVLARMAEGRFDDDDDAAQSEAAADGVVARQQGQRRPLRNVHMRFREAADAQTVTFLYEVGEGVAHRSYGLNVARLANVSPRVIARAGEMSGRLERKVRAGVFRGVVGRLLGGGQRRGAEAEEEEDGDVGEGGGELERLVEGIEQL